MDYLNKGDSSVFGLTVDETSKAILLETVRWTKFLAIIGFIGIGFMALAALAVFAAGSSMYQNSPVAASSVGLIYLFAAGLGIYPVIAMLKFSQKIKRGINSSNQADFNEGLANLKGMYRYQGIMTIIIFVFMIVAILAAILFFSKM